MNKRNIILLVEDNPDDEKLAVRALRRSNIANEIIVARNGQEALDMLFGVTEDGRPLLEKLSIVLLDLKLPKIDGLEVLRRIRENERSRLLPVIVLTTSSQEQDIIESYRLGANSYVRKPVDFEQFFKAVENLGLYWLVINQPPPKVGV